VTAGGPFDDLPQWAADEHRRERERFPRQGWYVVLPSWMPYQHGRTWEQFCAEFDESARRTHITAAGVVGFEIEPQAGQIRRHRIGWLDRPAAPPEEDTDAIST